MHRADPSLHGGLKVLARLYGLTRVQRSMSFYLTTGALQRGDVQAIREEVSGWLTVLLRPVRPSLRCCLALPAIDCCSHEGGGGDNVDLSPVL